MSLLAFKTKAKAKAFAKRLRGRRTVVDRAKSRRFATVKYECPGGAVHTARVLSSNDPEYPFSVELGCRRR